MPGKTPPPVVVQVSVGDVAHLLHCAVWAARFGSWDAFRRCLWVMREERRRGTWEPYTIGDMVTLPRLRRHVARPYGPDNPRPFWRHAPLLADRRRWR